MFILKDIIDISKCWYMVKCIEIFILKDFGGKIGILMKIFRWILELNVLL
jgi:hypothetical protein